MRRILAWVLVVAVPATLGCGGSDAEPDTGGSPLPRPTTTTDTSAGTAADPRVIPSDPADITPAYVEAVLRELYAIQRDALRLAMREGAVTAEVINLLERINTPKRSLAEINALADLARAGFTDVFEPAGAVAAEVVSLVRARLDCIVVEARLDFSAVSRDGQRRVAYVGLVPQANSWVFSAVGIAATGGPPSKPCTR